VLLLSDLGLAYLREGTLDSAVTYLKEALSRDPSMLVVRDAVEQYRIYLKSAPPGQARDRAREALKDILSSR
jgi:Tfp pilus assembly protein PilF